MASPVLLDSHIFCYPFARGSLVALMMEAVRTSEMSVNIYLTTRQYIPEDSKLHNRRRENLKPQDGKMQGYKYGIRKSDHTAF
jgi:hypothetical protein